MNKESPLTAVWRALGVAAIRLGRLGQKDTLNAKRLEQLEERVARLDGGSDAKASMRAAISATNIDAVSAGRETLDCDLGADGSLRWVRGKCSDAALREAGGK